MIPVTTLLACLTLVIALLWLQRRDVRVHARRRNGGWLDVTRWFYAWPLVLAVGGLVYAVLSLAGPVRYLP